MGDEAKGRALVAARTKESRGHIGHAAGASVAATAEFALWVALGGLSGGASILVAGVLVAALGAIVGGWVEYAVRRLFVAPGAVIDELQAKVDEYEEGPRFHIDIQEPVNLSRASSTPGGAPEAIMVTCSLRVTNEGARRDVDGGAGLFPPRAVQAPLGGGRVPRGATRRRTTGKTQYNHRKLV